MKALTTFLVLSGFLILSQATLAHAQTYGYVDQSGDIQTVTASSAEEAIAIAPNRAPHSGVIVDPYEQLTVSADSDTNLHTYEYVSTSGEVKAVEAVSPEQAFILADNRAPHSGVMRVSG